MTTPRRRQRRPGPLRSVACCLLLAGAGALATSGVPSRPAGASVGSAAGRRVPAPPEDPAVTNGYGPGVGPRTPGLHWGGAYVLTGVSGYAYCIDPGAADPAELAGDQWSPVAYPGSAAYSDGEMAALAYFAETYQGAGYPGYGADTTAAAIAQVAYASGGGTTPAASRGPAGLVALIEQYMVTYAGPWTIRLTMSPPSGSTFQVNQNYTGTVTVTSATGNGVGGLQLTAPPTGGPAANQISNFTWLAGTTNAAGQISFAWNIDGVPSGFGGAFSAQGISVVNNAVGTAPPAYGAPGGSGGQTMMVSGASEVLATSFGGVAKSSSVLTGTISVHKTVPDGAYYGPGGAQFQIETTSGTVLDTLTASSSGTAGPSIPLTTTTTGTQYVVHESVAPPGYGLAPDQTVTVFHGQNTAATFSGTYEEPVLAAQLGAEKVDATTHQPLAGATFAFAFDSANNGAYDQALGSCTTGGSGTCQPPDENAAGGWLPGWYQVTETAAPPGYWLPSPDPVQTVYLQPGATATASVTFADPLLGSLQLTKTGNDTAYWPVTGAVFSVSGPATATATVGTLTVGAGGMSNTLAGLVPGTYHLVETTAPPGYTAVSPWTVAVTTGHATTTTTIGDAVVPGQLSAAKVDATTGQPLAGATFAFAYDPADDGVYSQDLGSCTTGASGTCQPPDENTAGGWLPGWYRVTETAAPPGYWLDPAAASQAVDLQPGATATASATFADQLLGSLQLTKTGNDTAYWPITGAVFTVTGPAPATATVGTLTVGTGGLTNTLTGLVPGTYHLVETTAPLGYDAVTPWAVVVAAGHATTTTTAADQIIPGALRIGKVDAETGDPLAGAVFDVRYDPTGAGTYPTDLGDCTTTATGTCSPAGNDGTGLLPGNYQVTETAAPPGYYLPSPDPVQDVTVTPGATDGVAFADPLLVAASFHKVATGNLDPTQLTLAGAVIDVTAGATYGGTPVATCTTTATGTCTTAAVLVAGQPYCWLEVAAPPGLEGGATDCFTADNAQGTQPITVTDPGEFVAIQVEKVDAADPTVVLPGAVFDLYRVDGGTGPNAPTPPTGVPVEAGQTWVARATTGAGGLATFPLQLPGYAYCAVEQQAPTNFVLDTAEHCTTVLTGTAAPPPALATLTVTDAPALVTVTAHKFNSAEPDTGIPGAVYDLYAVGAGPPPGPPGAPPAGAASEPGDTWWARGTTSTAGNLRFTVPAGYAWCFKEVSAPVDYDLDPALHCTAVVTTSTPAAATTVALPETPATVDVYGWKFNAASPHQVIPGATYELVGEGTPPPGWTARPDPNPVAVPTGDWYDGLSTTNAQGVATWSVPAGHAWCLHEVTAPSGYQPDPAWHCTAVITTLTPAPTATVALPEVAVAPPAAVTAVAPPEATLAFTGGPPPWLAGAGAAGAAVGGALVLVDRRRRRRGDRRPTAAASGGPPDVPPGHPGAKEHS